MNGYEFVSPCSIPAVLCSDNWQSAISNAFNQPSTSNHVANEPIRLNQVTSIPIVIHHLPDFDQDSWTTNPPTGMENTVTDSFITTQLPDQTNNNNNNNTFSNGSQVVRCRSASDSRQSTDQLSAPSSTVNTSVTTSRMSAGLLASRQTLTFSATEAAASGAGSAMTTPCSQPSQLSGSTDEFQTTGAVASETMTPNDMAVEPQAADEMGSWQPSPD